MQLNLTLFSSPLSRLGLLSTHIMTVMTKEEIISTMDIAAAHVVDWYGANGAARWSFAPAGKWTAGQHLDHLIRSVNPIPKALGAPKVALRLSFGKPNRSLRSLEMIHDKYKKGLAGGIRTTGQFIPPDASDYRMEEMLENYLGLHQKLNHVLGKWSEKSLDSYLLPHPALGKMIVREMLYFTIIHTRHHLNILEERYQQV